MMYFKKKNNFRRAIQSEKKKEMIRKETKKYAGKSKPLLEQNMEETESSPVGFL